jgi:glucan phosphorylase
MTTKEFAKILQDKLTSEYGVDLSVASKQQIYRSLALICRQMMSENYKKFQSKAIGTGTKQVYYLCMEFLMGRSLKMSLFNLGLDEVAKKALAGENSADADYLRAVIATKEGDMKTAGAQLKAAVAKDSALVKKASKDVNLKPLFKSGFKF